VGINGMYPSRSELIRVAVRSFLIRELDVVDSFEEYSKKKPGPKPGKKLKIVHQEEKVNKIGAPLPVWLNKELKQQ
jgi:Arc/MetJ-type ribon-helix-helix transcriptional regulator